MIRDNIKNKEYFDKRIVKVHSFINEDIEHINQSKTSLSEIELKHKWFSILDDSLEILSAMYSRGDTIEEIKGYYDNYVMDYVQKGWIKFEGGGYEPMLQILSIGIMLESDISTFKILASLLQRDNLNDFLLNYLIKSQISEWNMQTDKFVWNRPYKAFAEIVSQSEEVATKSLEKYLNKEWYKGNKDASWYDIHKNEFDLYVGYWSFESGAVAKILNLDDSRLKDCQYYPYDLVNFKNKE